MSGRLTTTKQQKLGAFFTITHSKKATVPAATESVVTAATCIAPSDDAGATTDRVGMWNGGSEPAADSPSPYRKRAFEPEPETAPSSGSAEPLL